MPEMQLILVFLQGFLTYFWGLYKILKFADILKCIFYLNILRYTIQIKYHIKQITWLQASVTKLLTTIFLAIMPLILIVLASYQSQQHAHIILLCYSQ